MEMFKNQEISRKSGFIYSFILFSLWINLQTSAYILKNNRNFF